MPRRSKVNREAILADYLRGDPITEIATRYGIHMSYPALLAKRCGIPSRYVAGAPNSKIRGGVVE